MTDIGNHPPTEIVKLCLRGLPSELYVRNRRLLDDLVHELKMIRAGGMSGLEVDPALADTLESILAAYAGPRDHAFNMARDAFVAGEATLDVELEVPRPAVDQLHQILRVLEETEELSRRGVLLTVPAPPEIWALRRWIVREVERQLAGEEPEPFADSSGG